MLSLHPRLTAAAALFALLAAGCSRPPLERLCTRLDAGALVVTELRGPQSGVDTFGQWLELYNHTAQPVPMVGVTLGLSHLDGSGYVELSVRARDLSVAAGGYVVLGRFLTGEEPAHVQYGYRRDFDKDLYPDAILDVLSCGQLIDRVVYRGLPSLGTFALDGATPPDAAANDAAGAWCVDATPGGPSGDGGAAQLGVPGTPGMRNRPCP